MKRETLIGQKFNRLTVIDEQRMYKPNGQPIIMRVCRCDCGNPNFVYTTSSDLKNNHTRSCGCYQKEMASQHKTTENRYDLSGEYGIGYTSKDEIFLFDLEDYDKIKGYHWYISSGKQHYVMSWDDNHKNIYLHDIIMGGKYVDHIGGSKTVYDNRKQNLRKYGNNKSEFQSRNTWNSKIREDNTSGCTGVHFDHGKWAARITVDGKRLILGRFDSIEDAVRVRKEAEEMYFKEWSKDNSLKIYEQQFETK